MQNKYNSLFQDGYAPFLSMTTRNFSILPGDSILATPGPGQYDPLVPQTKVKVCCKIS